MSDHDTPLSVPADTDVQRIRDLESVPYVQPEDPFFCADFASGGGKPPVPPYKFKLVSELMEQPAATPWLIKSWLEVGELALLFGEPAVGKSFLVLQWAAAIACGQPWLEHPVDQGAVFVIAGEGHSGFARRMKALEQKTQWDIAGAPLFFSERPAALTDPDSAQSVADAVEGLQKKHGPPKLIIIDTLHRNLGGGDENNAADISQFLMQIDEKIRSRFQCTVLVVHHSGHGDKGRARGSSAIRAAVDHEYLLREDGQFRVLSCTKSKEHEPVKPRWFSLQPVALGWQDPETGEPLFSACLCEAVEPLPTADGVKLTRPQRIALEALRVVLNLKADREGILGPASRDLTVSREAWFGQAKAMEITTSLASDTVRKAFDRAKDRLMMLGLVVAAGEQFGLPPSPDRQDMDGQSPVLSATSNGQTGHTPIGVSVTSGGQVVGVRSDDEVF